MEFALGIIILAQAASLLTLSGFSVGYMSQISFIKNDGKREEPPTSFFVYKMYNLSEALVNIRYI